MNIKSIELGGENYLTTGPVCTGLHFENGAESHFDEEMLGHIAEWLAVAWVNVTGEEYKHREIGVPVNAKEYTEIPKRGAPMPGLDALEKLERDCE